MKKNLSLSISIFILSSCSFFIANKLTPELLYKIKDKIYTYDAFGDYFVYATDDNYIKLFKKKHLVKIIGNQNKNLNTDIPYIKYNFGFVGKIAVNSKSGVYVQDVLALMSLEKSQTKNFNEFYSEKDDLKSKLVFFDSENNIKLLKNEDGGNTFTGYINRMICDNRGRLFVIFNYNSRWRIKRFSNQGKVNFAISDQDINLIDKIKDMEYKGRIQSLMPSYDGNYLIIAISYYYKNELKYIKIIKYDIERMLVSKLIKKFRNLNTFLFGTTRGRSFYTWSTIDASLIIIKKYNLSGKLSKKYEMNLSMPISSWKDFKITSYRDIYSIFSNSEESIYEWF